MVLRTGFLTAFAVVVVIGGAAVAAVFAWPKAAVAVSTTGLAAVSVPGYSGDVEKVSVTDGTGKPLPVTMRRGIVWPRVRLAAGEHVTVTVDVRRPGWIGWLVGRHEQRTVSLVTPVAHIRSTLLRPRRGSAVAVRFAEPVSRVVVGHRQRPKLGAGRDVVPLGVVASGTASTGTTTVAAAARRWETLSTPVRVSWFVAGGRTRMVADPVPGSRLRPHGALTLTFARPVSAVLGSRLPTLEPATPGHWRQVDSHTLSFQPGGFGFGLGGHVHVRLPGQSLTWSVAAGSTLRLQEILARLGYLPLGWRPDTDPPPTPAGEVAAAVSPPHGTFSWRYAQTPSSLRTLWKPGAWNVVTQGAVMRFEDEHGLATDGVAGPQVWRALLRDDLSGRRSDAGYSYVFVHETVPQSLSLWHNGRVIVTSPGNTGIAQAPTAPGTWPVFEHIPVGTMSGTNPDGSHYHDPGIRWISYFHGGDALHAFPRASFGTPQSLGCVELPLAAAAQVWPYTPIGTLVTIES
ncbi:MAG TPA: L,D-transpeptidase family protein [Gaiellaceae bacterium]|nr:L,D-transpeptidase family protein [Gaiellaceae bacterium]